jgi:hypothetical protein
MNTQQMQQHIQQQMHHLQQMQMQNPYPSMMSSTSSAQHQHQHNNSHGRSNPQHSNSNSTAFGGQADDANGEEGIGFQGLAAQWQGIYRGRIESQAKVTAPEATE